MTGKVRKLRGITVCTLNKTRHPTEKDTQAIDALLTAHSVQREPESESSTLEEKLTLLGCFYLTSAYASHHLFSAPLPHCILYITAHGGISAYCKNVILLKYGLHREQCCQTLTEAGECENGTYMVYLVKLQHIVERIGENVRRAMFHFMWDSHGTIRMMNESFRSELESFKTSLSLELREIVSRWNYIPGRAKTHSIQNV